MFENYNFNPGIVSYNPYKLSPDDITDINWLGEDMVQVRYENGFILDVGWYGKTFTLDGVFIINIIKDYKWDKPVYKKEYRSLTELYNGMNKAIVRINILLKQ